MAPRLIGSFFSHSKKTKISIDNSSVFTKEKLQYNKSNKRKEMMTVSIKDWGNALVLLTVTCINLIVFAVFR